MLDPYAGMLATAIAAMGCALRRTCIEENQTCFEFLIQRVASLSNCVDISPSVFFTIYKGPFNLK